MVQWLGLGAFTAGTRVQSLVGELRSHKLCSAAKKKKTTKFCGDTIDNWDMLQGAAFSWNTM